MGEAFPHLVEPGRLLPRKGSLRLTVLETADDPVQKRRQQGIPHAEHFLLTFGLAARFKWLP